MSNTNSCGKSKNCAFLEDSRIWSAILHFWWKINKIMNICTHSWYLAQKSNECSNFKELSWLCICRLGKVCQFSYFVLPIVRICSKLICRLYMYKNVLKMSLSLKKCFLADFRSFCFISLKYVAIWTPQMTIILHFSTIESFSATVHL